MLREMPSQFNSLYKSAKDYSLRYEKHLGLWKMRNNNKPCRSEERYTTKTVYNKIKYNFLIFKDLTKVSD